MAVRSGLIGHGLHDLEHVLAEPGLNHGWLKVGVLERVVQPGSAEHVQVSGDTGIDPVADQHAHDLLEVAFVRFIGVQLLAVTGHGQHSGGLEGLLRGSGLADHGFNRIAEGHWFRFTFQRRSDVALFLALP